MNWREGPFVVGGLYRVKKSPGEGFVVGEEWVFWRNTYSSYDGLAFFFFVREWDFYPAAGDKRTELKQAEVLGWEFEDLGLVDRWEEFWEFVKGPQDGVMWMIEINKRHDVEWTVKLAEIEREKAAAPPTKLPEWPPAKKGYFF